MNAASLACAGEVSLQITVTTRVSPGHLGVRVDVTNRGNDTAYAVTPEVEAAGQTARAEESKDLPPRRRQVWDIPLQVTFPHSGTYPVIVTLRYEDANGYAFSALSVATAVSGEQTSAMYTAALTATPVSGTGSLRVTLRNLGDVTQTVRLTPVLPEELSVTEPVEVVLEPRGEATTEFETRNETALADSRYGAFVVAESDADNRHFLVVSTAEVAIVVAEGFPLRYQVAVLIALAAAFGILQWGGVVRSRLGGRAARGSRRRS
jgi:hypothetical protein